MSSPLECSGRQACQVHSLDWDEEQAVLCHENGTRGFGGRVPVVAPVSVDLRLSSGADERNQGWIEGGIFSMSFVLALHAVGVDSCMLNPSLSSRSLRCLRASLGIGSNELPIMMIAIGYGADGHSRATTPRRRTMEVVHLAHKNSGPTSARQYPRRHLKQTQEQVWH